MEIPVEPSETDMGVKTSLRKKAGTTFGGALLHFFRTKPEWMTSNVKKAAKEVLTEDKLSSQGSDCVGVRLMEGVSTTATKGPSHRSSSCLHSSSTSSTQDRGLHMMRHRVVEDEEGAEEEEEEGATTGTTAGRKLKLLKSVWVAMVIYLKNR